jgi:hypothetical protein
LVTNYAALFCCTNKNAAASSGKFSMAYASFAPQPPNA